MSKKICKRCGLKVEAELLERGVFNNRYRCPECKKDFGAKTLFNKGIRVAGFIASLTLLGKGGEDSDINLDS